MLLRSVLASAVAVTALALAAALPAAAADDPPEPAPPRGAERAALFAWLDGLGLPDVTQGDAVTVTTYSGAEPGFVTGRDGDATRVVTVSLYEPVARPLPEGAPEWERVSVVPLDLKAAVREIVADVERKRAAKELWMAEMSGRPSERARLVVLARACAARGLDAETEALLSEASIVPGCRDWYGADTAISLRERVENDLEHAFHARAFASPSVDDLPAWRDAYLRFAARFPRGRETADALHNARVLERMIAEEPSIPTEQAALALEGDERARALCARLRKMDHVTVSVNGGPSSVFAAEWGDAPSAADHLLAMGDAAIPALVAVCDDDTLTGISFTGRNDWYPGVLTVGACALDVLAKLAPDAGNTAAQVKTWWLRRTAPEDAVALVDRMLERIAAHEVPLDTARRLIETHTDLALWPLVLARSQQPEDLEDVAATNVWIELLGELDDPRVPVHLESSARRGGRLTARVAAIVALHRFDAEQALDLAERTAEFLHEESHATPDTRPGRLSNLVRVESEAARRLVELLAAEGRTAVLARRFDRQWPHVKDMVLRAAVRHAGDVTTGDARTILLAALADAAPFRDRHAIARAEGVANPRVKDAAALVLHARDAARWAFTPDADEAARDAQIAAIAKALAGE